VISNNNLLFFALVVLWEFVELNREIDQKIFLLLPFQKITGVHEMGVGTNNTNSSAKNLPPPPLSKNHWCS
jgi:hypothetical protein